MLPSKKERDLFNLNDSSVDGYYGDNQQTTDIEQNNMSNNSAESENETSAFVKDNIPPPEKMPVCYGCRRYFGCLVSREKRKICLNGRCSPRVYPSNKLRNQKYNIITLVPVVLFNQFKFFYNLFFLLIALSQFIPPLKVGFLFTYVSPLVFVLAITLAKEAWDDF